MSEKNKKADTKRVTLEVPVEKRAAGVKLPLGNPTILAKDFNSEKLPENLARIFEKINAKGKEGCKLSVLCPKTSEGKYTRWLLRTLINMGAARAIPEEKKEKAATTKPKASKKLTIAGAVAKRKRHLAKAGAVPAEAVAKSA